MNSFVFITVHGPFEFPVSMTLSFSFSSSPSPSVECSNLSSMVIGSGGRCDGVLKDVVFVVVVVGCGVMEEDILGIPIFL